ncbi:MAG: hypothetical protein MJ189_01120, partial [Coriobacteriales bacterium]|nr:hypothetical protein [Coriobacteriales bacterium]
CPAPIVEKTVYINGGAAGFDTEKTLSAKYGLSFDYKWLTQNCAAQYNNKLAYFASMLAVNAYSNSYVSYATGADPANNEKLMQDVGLDDVHENIEIGMSESIDSADNTSVTLGHKALTIDGRDYEVYIAAIVGTNNSSQWASNFDVGADTDKYFEQTGPHPEWTDTKTSKGFGVAANRVKGVIDNYMDTNTANPSAEKCLLTCGHSRGAAISDLVGAYYEDSSDVNSYTYTFATPASYECSSSFASSYKTIFNHFEHDDFFGSVPLAGWNFKHYGKDFAVDVEHTPAAAQAYEDMTGNDFTSSDISDLLTQLNEAVPNREALYEVKTMIYDIADHPLWDTAYLQECINYFDVGSYCTAVADTSNPDVTYFSCSLNPILLAIPKAISDPSNAVETIAKALPFDNTGGKLPEAILNNIISVVVAIPAHTGITTMAIAVSNPSASSFEHAHTHVAGAIDPTEETEGYTGDTYCDDCKQLVKYGQVIDPLVPEIAGTSGSSTPTGDNLNLEILLLVALSLSAIVVVSILIKFTCKRTLMKRK